MRQKRRQSIPIRRLLSRAEFYTGQSADTKLPIPLRAWAATLAGCAIATLRADTRYITIAQRRRLQLLEARWQAIETELASNDEMRDAAKGARSGGTDTERKL